MASQPVPSSDPIERARALMSLARECADEAERERQLPKRLAEALAGAGLHRLAVPADVGGAETDPETQIRAIEAISEADGAAGWNLMIGIENAGAIGAAFPPEVASALFSDPGVIFCGALNPLGRAERVETPKPGYRVSGRWPFASGCHNAAYFFGQCILYLGEERVPDEQLGVTLLEVLVPARDFEIVDTWHVSGLRGSGSHDVQVQDLFVPDRMTSQVLKRVYPRGPLFRMPLFSRLAYNKVGVATGIARAAIDHFVALATQKVPRASTRSLRERPDAQLAVADAETHLRSARAWVFDAVGELWETVRAGDPATREQRALLQLACSHAATASIEAVERVHSAAGASANFTENPLERCARDVRVVPQHIMVSPQWRDAMGRVLLGLDSGVLIL